MTQFKYFYQMEATGFLDVEDIGNFCLSLTNNLMREFIIIVKTEYGQTKVITFGPWVIDMTLPCCDCSLNYREFEFSESKIETLVDKALNGYNAITQATVITEEEARSRIKDLVKFI